MLGHWESKLMSQPKHIGGLITKYYNEFLREPKTEG